MMSNGRKPKPEGSFTIDRERVRRQRANTAKNNSLHKLSDREAQMDSECIPKGKRTKLINEKSLHPKSMEGI